MEILKFLFIFNCLVNVCFLLSPIWNIKNSSVEITTGEEKALNIYEGKFNNETLKLTKTIINNGNNAKNYSSGKILILDTVKGNHYGTSLDCDNYLFIPDNICIEDCNETLYVSNNKECGLCMDLYNGENGKEYKPYKFINGKECLEEKPKGTYYVYEKIKIIDNCTENCLECNSLEECTEYNDRFKINNGNRTEKCNPNCEDCEIYSDNNAEQNCTKCKDNMFLQLDKGNCVEECPDSYYRNDSLCLRCNLNCTKCTKGEEIMKNGEINQNCVECIDYFKYLISAEGYPNNCVNECPNDLNITDDKYCKILNINPDYILWGFILLIAIVLFLISLFLYKKYFSRRKNDSALINDINIELEDNKVIE